jgi:hypothetical protein
MRTKLPDRISRLEARIVALEMLLETIFVDQMATDRDPRVIAERITQDAYAKDEQIREQFGDHVTIELITDLTVSFLDRVVKRAQEQKLRRSKEGPSQ